MSYIDDILFDRDRRVRVFKDNSAVSSSALQSVYSRYLNLLTDFNVVENTIVGGIKTYDISLKYPYKSIPKEGNVYQGTVPRDLDFNDAQFDINENTTNNTYEIQSTGRVKVNAIPTIRKLNFQGNGVTAADDSINDEIDVTINDDKTAVHNNGTQVGTVGRKVNFVDPFAITEDTVNNYFSVEGGNIPQPKKKRAGWIMWSDDGNSKGGGLFQDIPIIDVGSGNSITPSLDDNGGFRRLSTSGDDDDQIGYGTNSAITRRSFNPTLEGVIRLPSQSSSGYRVIIGFHRDNIPGNNNTFLDNNEGILLSITTDTSPGPADTNWMIRRNDGDATTDSQSAGVLLTSTALLSFKFIMSSSSIIVQINGSTLATYTTEIPAATTNLRFICRVEEIGGTAQILDIYYIYFQADK